jgi:uncharacterized protein YutE (UPF0331/DUF86 family)
MSELGILNPVFARSLAHIAGFRNILIHEYLGIDWDEVYKNLTRLDDLLQFAEAIREWMQARQA